MPRPTAGYPSSPTRDRRNSSPSSCSSSGFSTPSTIDSSGRATSSSSDASPPSTSSSTPPDAQSKQASSVELVAPGSSSSSLSSAASSRDGASHHHQSYYPSSSSVSIPDSDQYHHHHHRRHLQPHYKPTPTPLYVDVKAGSTKEIGGIQDQVEAALYAHSNEQRRSENYSLEATLHSRLAAASSSQQQQEEEEDGSSCSAASEKELWPSPSPLPLPSANSRPRDRSHKAQAQAQADWVNDVIGHGRRETGENLIDAVIAHNAAIRLVNGSSGNSGSGSSNSSQRANARGQPNAPARPSMPIATKQLPYTAVPAYGRNSVESTPRANAINIPHHSRGEASPTSSSRPR